MFPVLLFSVLFLITPLLVSVKMAVAYSIFKLLTLGLTVNKIDTPYKQGRWLAGWLVGWSIAVQNLSELKQSHYSDFFMQVAINSLAAGLTAFAVGLLWFKLKSDKQQQGSVTQDVDSATLGLTAGSEIKRLSPLKIVTYVFGFLLLLSFKTGFSQYQLGKAYQQGYLVKLDNEKAIYWYQKAAALGYEYSDMSAQIIKDQNH